MRLIRVLIAVKSCNADLDRDYHNVIWDTWGQDAVKLGFDVRFFVGRNDTRFRLFSREYEIFFDCEDNYASLPYKTRDICQYAVSKHYDFLLLCDTDTFLIPAKLLECGFENYDYYGLIQRPIGKKFHYDAIDREGTHHPGEYFSWASGGYGYFLSRKLANIVAQTKPDTWAEDLWIGQIANEQYNHGRITIGDVKNLAGQCSWHFPAHEYNSGYDLKFNWMPDMYKKHKGLK
jgi:Galactosyltransferase